MLTLFSVLFYSTRSIPDKETKVSSLKTEDISNLLKALKERWELGDIEELYGTSKFKCLDIPNMVEGLSGEFLNCNPYYFRCVLLNNLKGVSSKFKAGELSFYLKSAESFKSFPNKKIQFKLEAKGGGEISIQLDNTCKDTYLPKAVYSAGPKGFEFWWDNIGQDIFIDRNYVSNFDIYLWKKTSDELRPVKVNANIWPLASTNLSLEEREEYCKSTGGKLLQSRFFDASTFLPTETVNDFTYKYRFPWGRREQGGDKVDHITCEKNFIKGCSDIRDLYAYSSVGVSWMGIRHSLGSYMEVFINKFKPGANLKVSNLKTNMMDYWNENGLRAFWKGGFLEDSFVLEEQYSSKNEPSELVGVAFRCMYQQQ